LTIIARRSWAKTWSGLAFLGGGAIYILSEPFWIDGGLPTLLAGGTGRRWWPVAAVAAVIILPLAVRHLIRILRRRGPEVFVEDALLHASQWREPVPLAEVATVEFLRFRLAPHRPPTVKVTLLDGTMRSVLTHNLDPGGAEIALRIGRAAGLPEPASQ
jgi:hypothetical protein